jgi:hypothetical protein
MSKQLILPDGTIVDSMAAVELKFSKAYEVITVTTERNCCKSKDIQGEPHIKPCPIECGFQVYCACVHTHTPADNCPHGQYYRCTHQDLYVVVGDHRPYIFWHHLSEQLRHLYHVHKVESPHEQIYHEELQDRLKEHLELV